jgi:hypothetical protein
MISRYLLPVALAAISHPGSVAAGPLERETMMTCTMKPVGGLPYSVSVLIATNRLTGVNRATVDGWETEVTKITKSHAYLFRDTGAPPPVGMTFSYVIDRLSGLITISTVRELEERTDPLAPFKVETTETEGSCRVVTERLF